MYVLTVEKQLTLVNNKVFGETFLYLTYHLTTLSEPDSGPLFDAKI